MLKLQNPSGMSHDEIERYAFMNFGPGSLERALLEVVTPEAKEEIRSEAFEDGKAEAEEECDCTGEDNKELRSELYQARDRIAELEAELEELRS